MTDKSIDELVAAIGANTLYFHDGSDPAHDAAVEFAAIAKEAEQLRKERDWLASNKYIAACPPYAPLFRPLIWSEDGCTIVSGGCGEDAARCVRCRIAAARAAVNKEAADA